MDLVQLLKPLMELEYQMHRLYMWYSDMYGSDPKLRNLFRLMAREELQHRDSVQNQFQLVAANLRDYEPVNADLEGVLQLTDLLNQQVNMRKSITIEEALSDAILLEKSAAESHYRFLIATANPVLRELIADLAQGDKEHLLRLEGFYRSLTKA